MTRIRRPGFTLVEMLVVMTIFALMLSTVSVTVATLWRAQADVQNELQQSAIVMQLARQLRADGHLALSAALSPAEGDQVQVLRLTTSQGRVEYALEPGRIVRMAYAADQLIHREVYSLVEMKITCSVQEETPTTLTLSVGPHEPVDVAVGLLSGGTP